MTIYAIPNRDATQQGTTVTVQQNTLVPAQGVDGVSTTLLFANGRTLTVNTQNDTVDRLSVGVNYDRTVVRRDNNGRRRTPSADVLLLSPSYGRRDGPYSGIFAGSFQSGVLMTTQSFVELVGIVQVAEGK